MGCDGGTIPRRDELVKTKKKPEAKDKDAERLFRWRHCAASQNRLRSPIVSCELGRLYNKETVLTSLLDKTNTISIISHIRGLKDIKELNLTRDPASGFNVAPKGDAFIDTQKAEYICPVTSQGMNGKTRFVFLWGCGCVVSERAMKEVKTNRCHKCDQIFESQDVININPSEEELDTLRLLMNSRRAIAKALKKARKDGKRSAEDVGEGSGVSRKKQAKSTPGSCGSQQVKGLLVRGMASDILKDKSFRNVRSDGFSVAKDPKVSDVYKSIFDTHKSAQNKTSAHWVTCNPHYM